MKIELDTTEKTITILEDIIVDELFIELEKLFPNGGWAEYTLVPLDVEIFCVPDCQCEV